MASRIKVEKIPTLTVNSAGDGFDDPSNTNYPFSSGTVFSRKINGEIVKIALNFTSSDADAILTLATRDSPTETVCSITGWASDITLYPIKEATDNANSSIAASNKSNVLTRYAAAGSLTIDCSSATASDTVEIKIFYR